MPVALRPDAGLLVLRVALGVIVLFHGISKVRNGVAWMAGPLSAVGLPSFVAYGSYVGEVIAPVMLIVGLWTRPAALVIAFNMLMAVILVLRQRVMTINPQGGGWAIELEALIFFTAIAVALAGGGRYAIWRGRV
jgi:putative oxidoreductase